MIVKRKNISQLHYDYNYSRDQIPVARMKSILNAVRGDGLEPVYVFFEKWKDVDYKQRDFEKLKLLYPKHEHEIMVNLEKEELQILLEELNIEEEEYINNALCEIQRMIPIYGNKGGYALMTKEDKDNVEQEKTVKNNLFSFEFIMVSLALIINFVLLIVKLVYYFSNNN
jgi:hypothetical protein